MKKYYGILWTALLFLSACSQEAETAIQRVLGVSREGPVFLNCKAVSPQKIAFQFSIPVKTVSLHFNPPLEVESITEGEQVQVNLSQVVEAGGTRIAADLLVEDAQRNTLNVLVPFRTRNDRLPALIITEIRTEYSKPKAEFVEIKTINAGNLGALRLFIASNGIETPVFEFPPVEVRAGEYVVIHLRSLEEGLVNETGQNLGASKGTEALADSRDFWAPESKKWIRKTDAVFFMDQDDTILDAVVLSEGPDSWKAKKELVQAVDLLTKQGAWTGDPVPSKAATATRTICRDEKVSDTNRGGNWYITATSGATPGKPNNPNRYVPKK